MESHHLVKSPILLGARKWLRRYLSTDSRRGGARLLEEEETCAICSPILFVHSRIIRIFFCKNPLLPVSALFCPSGKYCIYMYFSFAICHLFFVICLFVIIFYLCSCLQYLLPRSVGANILGPRWRAQRLRHHY